MMDRLPLHFIQLGITEFLSNAVPKGKSCWLVGGSIRDDILGKQPGDFDLAFDFDPTDLARSLASRLNGTFVHLDPGRHQSRIVFFSGGQRKLLDLSPLRAATLETDLLLRDFRCNAMACNLKSPGSLIDPLGGERDLLDGILRTCSEHVLRDDPLRILKGVRHAVELHMALHEDVCRQFLEYRYLLNEVAIERITAEMGRIFSHSQVHIGVSMLNRFEIIEAICPSSGYALDLAGLQHVLSAERRLEDSGTFTECSFNTEDNWPLYALVRLCRSVVSRQARDPLKPFAFLKQSKKAVSIANMLHIMRTMEIPTGLSLDTRRKRALWLDQFHPAPQAAALFGASLNRFNRYDLVSCLSAWSALEIDGRIPDLISPGELVNQWGVKPDANLGKALAAVREDEIFGRISASTSRETLVRDYFKSD